MTKLCQKTGCSHAATHALQLGVPGLLDPDEAPSRVKILLGVEVCEAHMDGESADRWFAINPTLTALVGMSMGQEARPDFARAVILGVPVDSEEYRQLQLQGLLQKKAH